MSIFGALHVYPDDIARSAAMNMAVDEALLEKATATSIRFYRWNHPALSFGYFGQIADVAAHNGRDCVRRWTGGGIVLHGQDLTYALVIPAKDPGFSESSMSIYEKTHRAIQTAIGADAQLATEKSPKISESCFANAVRADVLLGGRKVAGAAQRRTRRGLLQQGSIQHVDLAPDFAERFARALSSNCVTRKIDQEMVDRASEIAAQKYGRDDWLRRR